MNIVIVDDEKSCVKALADKLNEYDDTNLVGVHILVWTVLSL